MTKVAENPGMGVIRQLQTEEERIALERNRTYKIARIPLQYSNVDLHRPIRDFGPFLYPGDHIHLLELQGSDSLAIQLGSSKNQYLPFEEGMTYKRDFDRFMLRPLVLDGLNGIVSTGFSVATILISYGNMIDRSYKEYGFKRNFKTAKGIANETNQSILKAFIDTWGFGAAGRGLPLIGKRGMTLRLKNLSTNNILYYGTGETTSFAAFLDGLAELEPRESVTLKLDSLITAMNLSRTDPTNDPFNLNNLSGFVVASDIGLTVPYKVTLSKLDMDSSEPECGQTFLRTTLEP